MVQELPNLTAFLNAGTTAVNNFILSNYRAVGMANEEFLVYLQVKLMVNQGAVEPSTEQIGKVLGWSAQTVFDHLEKLRAKGLLNFRTERDAQGRVKTALDFEPFYIQILQLQINRQEAAERIETPVQDSEATARAEIFTMIEQEFGRQLSPMEYETITGWFNIDHFKPELIKQALQEAVINQALNLRYIESILVAWQKRNIRSVQEVVAQRDYRRYKKQISNVSGPEIPLDVDILNTDWS